LTKSWSASSARYGWRRNGKKKFRKSWLRERNVMIISMITTTVYSRRCSSGRISRRKCVTNSERLIARGDPEAENGPLS
jgi:hypothetical protein